jgi:hypothetical protein
MHADPKHCRKVDTVPTYITLELVRHLRHYGSWPNAHGALKIETRFKRIFLRTNLRKRVPWKEFLFKKTKQKTQKLRLFDLTTNHRQYRYVKINWQALKNGHSNKNLDTCTGTVLTLLVKNTKITDHINRKYLCNKRPKLPLAPILIFPRKKRISSIISDPDAHGSH